MSDIAIRVHYQSSEKQTATDLADDLRREIQARNIDRTDLPDVELGEGFHDLPDLATFGSLSLLVLLLPDPQRGGFSEDERQALLKFRKGTFPDNRLVPVSIATARDRPPVPIDDIKSYPLHKTDIARLATLLLNLVCLRLSGDKRKVFISYKLSDGTPCASAIADGLRQRGYTVWRDEDVDRDGLGMLMPGEPSQVAIKDAIRRHGLVLVIDTMEAPLSGWVHAEIETAINDSIPVMPVVIEEATPGSNPKLELVPKTGGRFRPVRELGREERISNDLQSKIGGGAVGVVNDAAYGFFDRLEKNMNDCLLAHLRSRRRLIHEASDRFKRRGLPLVQVAGSELLYRAEKQFHVEPTPGLLLRFLVQCTPYDALLQETVDSLSEHFKRQDVPHQYGVLVHQTAVYPHDRQNLIRGCSDHVMLVHTDEIDKIPSIFRF
jgi:hypothetical protein